MVVSGKQERAGSSVSLFVTTFAVNLLVKVNHTAQLRVKRLRNKLCLMMEGGAKSYYNEECIQVLQRFVAILKNLLYFILALFSTYPLKKYN